MSQSRRSCRLRIEVLEERATPTPTPAHVLIIDPPAPSAAPTHQVLITQSACHAIDAHAEEASGVLSCNI
jgi:hypothetical protein